MEKEKMNLGGGLLESKKKKRKVRIGILSIVLVLVLLLGLSYAWFTLTLTGTKQNVIKVGNLSLNLDESMSEGIHVDAAIPTLYSSGLESDPYTFTLSNDGSVPSAFKLIFHDDNVKPSGYRYTLSNHLYYSLSKNGHITSIGMVRELTKTAYLDSILDLGIIEPKQSNQYELRLWLDANYEESKWVSPNEVVYTISVDANQLQTQRLSTRIKNLGTFTQKIDDMNYFSNVDNAYIWYSGKLWNAIGYTDQGEVKAVTSSPQTTIPWGTSLSYENSYVRTWVNDSSSTGFLGNLHDYEKFLVTDYAWDVSNATQDTTNDKIIFSNEKTVVAPVGILSYKDVRGGSNYTGSSIATSDFRIGVAHGTYYLSTSMDSTHVMVAGQQMISATVGSIPSQAFTNVSPAIVFQNTINVVSGSGTKYDPFILEGDLTAKTNDFLNTRNSGEYVAFGNGENNLYRIESISNGVTQITASKPILGVFYEEEYNYEASEWLPLNTEDYPNFSLSNFFLKEYLNPFYGYVSKGDLQLIENNSTWYHGTVSAGQDYHNAKDTTKSFTSSVSLPTIGDLQGLPSYEETQLYTYLDLSYSTNMMYLTTNASNSQLGSCIACDTIKTNGLIRPTVKLKNTVRIVSGTGTFFDPYILKEN